MSTQDTTNTRNHPRRRWRDHARIWMFAHPRTADITIFVTLAIAWFVFSPVLAIGFAVLLISICAAGGIWGIRWLDRRLTEMEAAFCKLEQQMDHMKGRGIYLIYCIKEDASYLGSTEINFHIRWGQHITQLDRGEHHNPRLQEAWRTYGPSAFYFSAIELIDDIEDIRPCELTHLEWRALNMPAKLNYNVANSRMRSAASPPDLQFVYPTKIVHAPALRIRSKRKPGGTK